MILSGEVQARHLVELFLTKEYAGTIRYPNKLIKFGHHKGSWYFFKLNSDDSSDWFNVNDFGAGFEAKNELTHGLIEEMEKKHAKRGDSRWEDAQFLVDILKIWAGSMEKIEECKILQPGRNAWVKEDGEWFFSPRPEEFCQ